jgi:dimethylhistidine N-methyltransferase
MSALFDLAIRPVADTDLSPFARDVLDGLSRPVKQIPSLWLYDRRGSELFEQITALPEYYPARTEQWLLERCVGEIAAEAGPGATLIELGSGSSRKTRLLLAALERPSAYLPIDISEEFLLASAEAVREQFPDLHVAPLVADFSEPGALEFPTRGEGRRLLFFPGSTIGNFTPDAAIALLQRLSASAGPGALLVIGTDANHDPASLVPAYDDAQGVTAAFNRNLLMRINRELGGDFSPDAFRHEARWDASRQRMEMHLVSEYTQRATVLGREFRFAMGESIHTENSYKYGVLRFQAMAGRAGWSHRQVWTDSNARFAVHVFEATARRM